MFDLIEEEKSKIPLRSTAGTAGGAGPTCHHRFIDFAGSSFLGTYLLGGGTTLKEVSLVLPLAIIEYQRVGACIESPFARPLLALVRKQPSTT